MRPPCSIGPNGPRQLAMVVKRSGSGAGAAGQSSSTTGCRTGCQSIPPVGIGHAGVPISSPMVK